MENEKRPWGEFFILDETSTHKAKKIVVRPGQRLSYQYHKFRSEVWVVTSGQALITIDDIDKTYHKGEIALIPLGAKHRVKNNGLEDLVFIEVQLGTYFGEDDIVRIEDDYQRS
jgi:mannose-6-phosphate isomerase